MGNGRAEHCERPNKNGKGEKREPRLHAHLQTNLLVELGFLPHQLIVRHLGPGEGDAKRCSTDGEPLPSANALWFKALPYRISFVNASHTDGIALG
jgi:hypothetical protein